MFFVLCRFDTFLFFFREYPNGKRESVSCIRKRRICGHVGYFALTGSLEVCVRFSAAIGDGSDVAGCPLRLE
jgi:hypothetical protein